jgi:transposase
MARPISHFALDPQQERALRAAAKAPSTPQRVAQRCRVLLHRGAGLSQAEAGRREGLARNKVGQWERRFATQGLAGLADQPGRGRQSTLDAAKKARVLTEVTRPPKGHARWTVRTMARHAGVSVGAVHGLWRANDLKPHRTRTFKLSRDPQFEPKFWDVIGLYLNPPQKALVLCCDEKSQCQALERTQPGLPLGVGHIRTRTHDYLRHGTVTLFAALSYLSGQIFGLTAARHTHKEWLAFLKLLDRQTPPELELHLIIDNYATHKHPAVRAWLAKHPRFHLHFTPTSSSWLNLVERFFADLTAQVVREGSFGSVRELTGAIETYLAERNLQPKAYRWRAKGADILAKIQRAKAAQNLCHAIS